MPFINENLRLATTDIYGRTWPGKARTGRVFCDVCGQPVIEAQNEDTYKLAIRFSDPITCHHCCIPERWARELGATVPKDNIDRERFWKDLYQPNRPVYVKHNGRHHCIGMLDHQPGLWPEGHYLMTVRQGGASYASVDPVWVEVEAALRAVEETMTKVLSEANKALPDRTRLSDRELKAWRAYCKVLGNDGASLSFRGCSMHGLVQAGLDVVRQHLKAKRSKR